MAESQPAISIWASMSMFSRRKAGLILRACDHQRSDLLSDLMDAEKLS